ncbi:MAG TPA: cbb3-type cytochrome oxidase assembly protein CcoS [Alphaproteobacteria bacterium]|nr:cbb3-type cytochrome oxidase assembly protein CcoS [Alphaproteobacteria bacterium]HNS43720.1 cbb3-type cytochrome oxidase assembly protein CcoS [Alphaproteobacteria bacterium]
MSVLAFLIPLALVLGGCGLAFFIWTIRTGQYEDLEGAAHRILIDDDFPLSDEPEKKEDSKASKASL